jgi:hypothetical protein
MKRLRHLGLMLFQQCQGFGLECVLGITLEEHQQEAQLAETEVWKVQKSCLLKVPEPITK